MSLSIALLLACFNIEMPALLIFQPFVPACFGLTGCKMVIILHTAVYCCIVFTNPVLCIYVVLFTWGYPNTLAMLCTSNLRNVHYTHVQSTESDDIRICKEFGTWMVSKHN